MLGAIFEIKMKGGGWRMREITMKTRGWWPEKEGVTREVGCQGA